MVGSNKSSGQSGQRNSRSRQSRSTTEDARRVENAVRRHLQQGLGIYGNDLGTLEPVEIPGIGTVYTDGLQPVDPSDCQRWPGSPYCQHTDNRKANVTAAIPRKFYLDVPTCLAFFTFEMVVLGYRMPSMTIAKWDEEECGPPPGEEIPPEPEPEPSSPEEEPIQGNYLDFSSCAQFAFVVDATGFSIHLREQSPSHPSLVPNLSARFPKDKPSTFYFGTESGVNSGVAIYGYPLFLSNPWQHGNFEWGDGYTPKMLGMTADDGLKAWGSVYHFTEFGGGTITLYRYSTPSTGAIIGSPTLIIYAFNFNRLFKKNAKALESLINNAKIKQGFPYQNGFLILNRTWSFFGHYDLGVCNPAPPPPPPPSPPLLPPMDDCCAALLRLTREMHKSLRAGMFGRGIPAKLPRSLVQPGSTEEVLLNDYVDVFEYQVRHLDRVLGKPPWGVVVEDADLQKPGKQTTTFRFESLGEMVKNLLQIKAIESSSTFSAANGGAPVAADDTVATNRTLLRALIAILFEIGVTHKMTAEIRMAAEEILEALGVQVEEETDEIKMAFSPLSKALQKAESGSDEELKNVLPKLFEQSKVPIKWPATKDKHTLYSMLSQQEIAIRSIQAGLTSRVKSETHFRDLLNGAEFAMEAAQLLLLREIKAAMGHLTADQFADWIDDFMARYTENQSPVAADQGKPYQRSSDEEVRVVINKISPQSKE